MTNIGPIDDVVRVSMLAPNRDRCGISDYSRNLISAMAQVPSVSVVRCLEPPASESPQSNLEALAGRSSRSVQFRKIGAMLSASPAQLIHVQHEYSLFGGVGPHRNTAPALYASATLPLVLTVHEIVEEQGSALRKAAIRHVNRLNFVHPSIAAWIVHTGADRERLAAVGVRSSEIQVVSVGVPTVQVLPAGDAVRKRIASAGRRVITMFGFLSAKKAYTDALEAMAKLPEDIVLVLAGDKHPDDHTSYVSDLKCEIERRGLAHRVIITGYLSGDEVAQLMSLTDLALAPYRNSSGSASVAYLLAAGMPVVASDIPVFRELNSQLPGTLELTPPGRPDLLAGAIQKVINSAELLHELRNSAQRYAAMHTFGVMAEATAQVYKAALS